MKKLFILVLVSFFTTGIFAQSQINPQLGLSFQKFTNPSPGIVYDAKVGNTIGLDLRMGDRLQIQPGLFYVRSVTGYETNLGQIISDNIIYNSFKAKVLVNLNLVNTDGFKLRVNAGPSYDFLLSAKYQDSEIDISDSFKNGTLYAQAGAGLDIWFLTAELGYMMGLTDSFEGTISTDSKNIGMYFTVGVIFGN
jgi:hypothetical protein